MREDNGSAGMDKKADMTDFGFRQVPVREKAGLVLRHFNSIAAKYDFMNTVLSFGIQTRWKRLAVNALGLKPGDLVLDVCGGTADLSIIAAQIAGPAGHVVLYDINRAMIEEGIPKIERAFPEGNRITCIQGDAESLSFLSGRFDAVMVGFGIRNLTHMNRGLQEMQRVLKPGGRFMCLEFSLPPAAWFYYLYEFYSFRLMPLAGKLLAGTQDAYLYLPESIRRFPSPDVFAETMQKAGFTSVAYRRLTKGIAVIYTGVKNET
jgi:demethylmenaquinone methyltransferase/2-methoxy-6-polyprenyl-1,4-benzoquinol methylase